MSQKGVLRLGTEYFKQSRYEEALEVFDKAIRENEKDKTLFDSRAAVFEKLDRPMEALKDSKKVIDLAPGSWQGYARSARLFLQFGKPAASLQMVNLALDRLKSADAKRRAELESLRDRAVKVLEPPPCYFSRLPVEMQTEIFSLVIDGSNSKMLALALVCRSWREIIVSTPKFWRHLTLTQKTTLKKADTWLERANGTLSILRIAPGFRIARQPRVFQKASSSIWLALDTLEIHDDYGSINAMLPTGASEQLQLRSLVIDIEYPTSLDALWSFFRSLDTSRTCQLELRVGACEIPLRDLAFTGLVNLSLQGSYLYGELLEVLRRNANLETLELLWSRGSVIRSGVDQDIEPVVLINLRRFESRCHLYSGSLMSVIRFPGLRVLSMSDYYSDGPILEAVASQELVYLEELHLHNFRLTTTTLLSIIERARGLRSLTLSSCSPSDDVEMDFVIETLAKTASGRDDSTQTNYCPRLQHVDLSSTQRLKAGPVIRLVKAHLPRTSTPTDNNSKAESSSNDSGVLPLPILSLSIDNCPSIDAEVLPWLRANVPNFSCKMKPVKMGRGQR